MGERERDRDRDRDRGRWGPGQGQGQGGDSPVTGSMNSTLTGTPCSSFQDEQPPFSRLFVVCNRSHSEEELRNAFGPFGKLEELKLVRDRKTGDNKGLAYVKYSKTSEAARALEELHLTVVGNVSRPIKVIVASGRHESTSRNDANDEQKYLRLFVIIPRSMTDKELTDEFSKFGRVEFANVVKDKETRESKGFGYVRYKKFSDAANAFENADRKYKAIFAEPKKQKPNFDSGIDSYMSMSQSPQINLPGSSNGNASAGSTGDSVCRLKVLCAPVCQHQHIWRLFNIVPGLVECRYQVDIVRQVGEAFITYSNAQAARYARDKLHGLEYPPGAKLEVRLDAPRQSGCSSNIVNNGNNSIIDDNQQGLAQLAETIVKATNLLQASLGNKEESLCNVRLPSPKPLACIDSPVAQRCFLVCQPHPPPISALRDVFSRFGDLIDVYTLHNKTVGYAMYASTKSAEEARKVLHGAEVCGIRLKVMEAKEHPRSNSERSSSPTNHSSDYDDRRKRFKCENSQT